MSTDSAASALERAALRVLDEARRSGSVTVKAREDLAEALGLPREAARGRWHGWHGGTGEAAAKERLERAWGDRYEQDAKDEASAAQAHRYVLTAVVIVPSDEPRTEAGLTSDLTTALREAGYLVKWADAREVTEVRA